MTTDSHESATSSKVWLHRMTGVLLRAQALVVQPLFMTLVRRNHRSDSEAERMLAFDTLFSCQGARNPASTQKRATGSSELSPRRLARRRPATRGRRSSADCGRTRRRRQVLQDADVSGRSDESEKAPLPDFEDYVREVIGRHGLVFDGLTIDPHCPLTHESPGLGP